MKEQGLREALLLYAIVDVATVQRLYSGTVVDFARELLTAGVKTLQLRDKRSPNDVLAKNAAAIASEARRHGAYFFVNDYAEIADEVGADGVHVGQRDTKVAEVRSRYPHLLIGASARTEEDAVSARVAGANYLGCGPIWDATASKPDLPQPIGLDQLQRVVRAVPIPVVGIGGINASNAAQVLQKGAVGVAIIRALFPSTSQGVCKNVQILLNGLQIASHSEITGPLP